VVLGCDLTRQQSESDQHFPSNVLPVLACRTEFKGLRTLPAVGLCNANRDYPGVNKRENGVPRCNLPHTFIEGVPGAVGVALGRPQVSATYLVAICLVLIDPPVAHVTSRSLAEFRLIGIGFPISRFVVSLSLFFVQLIAQIYEKRMWMPKEKAFGAAYFDCEARPVRC